MNNISAEMGLRHLGGGPPTWRTPGVCVCEKQETRRSQRWGGWVVGRGAVLGGGRLLVCRRPFSVTQRAEGSQRSEDAQRNQHHRRSPRNFTRICSAACHYGKERPRGRLLRVGALTEPRGQTSGVRTSRGLGRRSFVTRYEGERCGV